MSFSVSCQNRFRSYISAISIFFITCLLPSMIFAQASRDSGFIAYIDLHAQTNDKNHPNVLSLIPECVFPCETSFPLEPTTIWQLKSFETGEHLPITMMVDMQVRYATLNGANVQPGTEADRLFGRIIDGVGGYELDPDHPSDQVTLTFRNLNPEKEYTLAAAYNRNHPQYTNRGTRVSLLGTDASGVKVGRFCVR